MLTAARCSESTYSTTTGGFFLDRIMTSEVEKVCKIKECVQCGYCCKVAPCKYGKAHNFFSPHNGHPKSCIYLTPDDPVLGTYKCTTWNNIKDIEKNSRFPMCGSGCSSTLFNDHRHRVLQKIREMAVSRLMGEITHEDR